MKEGTEGLGVHGVEGGLTLGLLPTGLVKHPAPSLIQGLLPSPSSSTSAPPSHYVSAGGALGIRKKWSPAGGISETKLEARKHRLLPPRCKSPELQGEAVLALPFTAL